MPNGSANYYERVLERDPNARDFFRYFEAPGVEHCFGGPGAYPGKAFEQLVGKSHSPNLVRSLQLTYVSSRQNGSRRGKHLRFSMPKLHRLIPRRR